MKISLNDISLGFLNAAKAANNADYSQNSTIKDVERFEQIMLGQKLNKALI